MLIHPVLLCGGSGTRLWPLSRKSYPKQFTPIMGERSLLQSSARLVSGPGFAAPTIVTAADFRFIVTEQLAEIGIEPGAILLEPSPRNTAPAILAAALSLGDDSLVLVTPSDHVIPDPDRFRQTLLAGVPAARQGQLVTFGIKPDRAETGYGWLELNTSIDDLCHPVPLALQRFVEKPDAITAQTMLATGRHLWNAGVFLFRADAMIRAFQTYQHRMLAAVQDALAAATPDLGFTRLGAAAWDAAQDISIDYAVMEKADNLTVIPYGGEWSDLGGWEAVWRESVPDAHGVVTTGASLAIDCRDTLLRSETETMQIVGIGLDNIVAVAMPDAVLVAHKDCAQDVKQAVSALKRQRTPQAETLPRAYRPWGWYESLALGPHFQVKRIHVHPGAALSLQSHKHRSEHWVVVQGTAKVTVDDEIRIVTENQSVFIPLGAVHRLENAGSQPMVLIEVQTGSYLGEDDIIRYDDVYARALSAPD
ncbi:mannose-1-phosphate guanylyltransferase/mannose-6-phosphate isomerase [Roseibaca sp. Y0-43]|uniref:mannose-1-phosphate guanylyltransferase/mannose-6-phosphate isomerase n=1 Tax=Roseibaca sp. Y0-43 TaxID=2816854 RepID=UPI001D0CCD42|nr:mannose-1-phosphate guanylyltransferase/mannose-6-phosphate isomerase [Roseibaca sp. Y0-43]MCC1482436.1 mannose-1-phosphate guanylyltransferase/mannose-6-phosphate isomerase [Roseibaca sp. Y0-43]